MHSPVQQDLRIKRRLPCDLSFDGGHHSGIVLNVSRSGLFVQVAVAADPGSVVAVDLNGPSGQDLELDARVIWKRIVPSGLMRVAHGGVGLRIKRASESYYEFLRSIVEPTAMSRANAAPLLRYRVRLKQIGSPRSRSLSVFARSEDTASDQALREVGEGWSVMDIELRGA